MAFPETLEELQRAGFVFKDTGTCKGCQAKIAWFITPKQKWMPFSRKPGNEHPKRFESHHTACPERDKFRKGSADKPPTGW